MPALIENRYLHIGGILLVTWLVYLPGLDSLYLFDDSPNLAALAQIQGASLFSPDFWEFVLAGEAGPTGRPVSLFTFALQATAWPDNPAAIKTVNLFIHSLSAVLVYLVSFRLAFHLQGEHRRSCLVAISVALVWALHPVQTSTVLYAVQRMALLSNFFILLGICLHLHIRLRTFANPYHELFLLTLSLTVTGLLALFSKENAPSLVFYLLVLEYTLLRNVPVNVVLKRWRYLFLWLPAVVMLLLPLLLLEYLQEGFAVNFQYTMLDRLLTQTRVLWIYLGSLFLPATAAIGIFHEVPVSVSLVSPPTTLLASLAWAALLGLVLYRPGRHGIWLFSLLWFWSGHVVESTVLALELFFHHRNYLAFFGFIFALIYALYCWLPATFLRGNLRVAVAGLYLVLLAINTLRISSLWSQPLQLAERWYEAEPATVRNAEFYAMELAKYGNDGEQLAAAVLEQAVADNPDNFHVLLNLATLGCVNPGIRGPDEDILLNQAQNLSVANRDPVSPMQQIVSLHLQGNCPRYSSDFLAALLTSLAGNTTGYDRGMFQFDLARIRGAEGDQALALQLMANAYDNARDPGILFNLAIQLINAGRYTEALDWIDQAIEDINNSNNIRTGTRTSKLATLNSMREDVIAFMAESQ